MKKYARENLSRITTLLLAALMLAAAGSTRAVAQTASAATSPEKLAEKTAKRASLYRVNFVVRELEDGKRINERNFSLLLEEDGYNSSLRIGDRVPLRVDDKNLQYLDVGFNLDCRLTEKSGLVELETVIEFSNVASSGVPNNVPLTPTLRQTKYRVHTLVQAGKPTLILSADQFDSKRRLEIEVVAVKVVFIA